MAVKFQCERCGIDWESEVNRKGPRHCRACAETVREEGNGPIQQQRKEQKFVELAEARTDNILSAIQKLGNLANRANYSYTDEDVQTIFKAIERSVRDARERFREPKFKLRP